MRGEEEYDISHTGDVNRCSGRGSDFYSVIFDFKRLAVKEQKPYRKNILYDVCSISSATGIPWFRTVNADLSVNLIPFADIFNSPVDYIKNSLLNIVLFIPAGMFLPLLWKEFQNFKKTAVFGFGLSLVIEVLQIFTFRLSDVDDLITNTLGSMIGYVIANQLFYVLNGKLTAERGNCRRELPFLAGVVFLVCFTVQPYLAEYFWGMFL